ncbi:MarR family winged helix-turn-helix transcriptional regulator [Chelativorans salis]|uniref:MarR family transcriptional regulator n=1 Tax=Chelativorans salis TaxID=2978478 RepID=A0ABT2LMP8_9HYPH|nr:MarR family transcriptional regulator [Chelativorans sp. EGI FJ00035]MCT7374953.1 MarR family transcriptional regulator [Chelativorans sp. EGI FJ00035]
MIGKPDEATVAAWVALARAARLTTTRIEERLKAAELPPLAWYDALWELEKAGDCGLRPFELEKALLFEQYNLSRLADRLATAGLIERGACPEDKRGLKLRISAQGRALRRDMWEVYAVAIRETVGDRLSEEEAQTLARLLRKLE